MPQHIWMHGFCPHRYISASIRPSISLIKPLKLSRMNRS